MICKQFPQSIIYHYMDGILIDTSDMNIIVKVFAEVQQILPQWGLEIAFEKIQRDSLNYLGIKLSKQRI